MKAEPTSLPDVIRLTPQRLTDARGYFIETFRLSKFHQATGTDVEFKALFWMLRWIYGEVHPILESQLH